MVIAKGDDWGENVHKQGVVCTLSDHDVFLHQAYPVRGDIAQTIGSELGKRAAIKQFDNRTQWHQLPFDVIEVDIDGVSLRAAAHIRMGHLLWGECHLLSNVAFYKGKRVFAKSHPNDGKIEVLTMAREMGIRQRFMALMKVRQGSHLPHPHLVNRQVTQELFQFRKSLPIFIDGKKIGNASELRILVIADAINIYIPSDQE
jgi:hypothetical protein